MTVSIARLQNWLKDYRAPQASPSRLAASAAVLIIALYAAAMAILKWLPVNDALIFAAALWLMFLALDRCTPRARTIALHIATQVLVLSWVFHLWTLGYEGRNAVFGGILPWSDSFGYYNDALRLIHGNLFDFAAKRPIFAVALAGFLRLFDGDLRLALLLFAAFAAWAIALAASEVWKTHGRPAAIVVYALLLLSERQWAGFVQTEAIGLPLGLIGFVLIWRATSGQKTDPRRALLLAAAGLLAITIGLMARAGPFFILPALALWCAMRLAPPGALWPRRVKYFAVASAAIVAGVAVHAAVSHLTASGTTFSDYPAIVYGLVHGKDFTLLLADHPHLAALTGSARAGEAWRIVIGDAAAHPLGVIGGLGRSFVDLFITPNGLLGFVWRNPDDIVLENGAAVRASLAHYGVAGPLVLWFHRFGLYSVLNAVAMFAFAAVFVVATTVSMVRLYLRRGDSHAGLLRYAIAGVLLSAPFTPPWITPSHHVEVPTLAFLAAVPATMFLGRMKMPRTVPSRLPLFPAGIGVALVLMAVMLRHAPEYAPACRQANHRIVIRYPGTAVEVVPSRTLNLRERARDDLAFSLQYLKRHNPKFTASLAPYLKHGTVYTAAYDACGHHAVILVDDNRTLDLAKRGWQPVRARPLREPQVMHVLPDDG